MKILITGANGTVGSDLVYFFSKYFFVYAIYRSSNFVNKKLRSNRIKWIKHDLSEEIRVKINPNVIIHCAVTHEFKKNSKAEDYVNSNILSLQNLVKFAIKKKDIKFFNFSTFSIYKNSKTNFLSITKLISEHLLKKSKIDYLNIRLPGVLSYINKDTKRPWLNTIINNLRYGKTVSIFNKNKKFNSVIDTFEIFKFISSQLKNKKMPNGIINFQASDTVLLKSLIDKIKLKFNSKSNIKYFERKDIKNLPLNKFKLISIKKFDYKISSVNAVIDRYLFR